jgi:glutamyl-tRNA reductase
MDHLTSLAPARIGVRHEEPDAETIVTHTLEREVDSVAELHVARLLAALHQQAERIRVSELTRFRRRLATLDPAQTAAVEALTEGIVAKLLDEPTVNVKAAAGTTAGEQLAERLRQLFALNA